MSIGLKGGPELAAFLQALPDKLQRNVVRGAMRAAARVVQIEARLNVPIDTGLTKKAIVIRTSSRKGVVKATLRVRGNRAYIANFIEYGTAAHPIKVKFAKRRKRWTAKDQDTPRQSLLIDGRFVGKAVFHPGTPARPFFRPALDSKSREAVAAAATYVRSRLTKEGLAAPDFGVADDVDE